MESKTNRYNFQKLTPTNDIDLKVYGEALDFVFQEEDLKNIAITGAYSAGKSSVLDTYKDNRTSKSFLNISLAHFESYQEDDTSLYNESSDRTNLDDRDKPVNATDNKYSDTSLEGKILNQLIHQITADKIPLTHFKIKKQVPKLQMIITTTLVSLFLGLLIYILGFNSWSEFIQSSNSWIKNALTFTTKDSLVVFAGIICASVLIYGLFKLVMMIQYNKLLFKKLNLNGNEIEVLSDDNTSYFDKYLNEVLYLFENAGADVIVFEDMDRFNSNKIFEKIREINELINKKTDKNIRFFYLLRDDVFISKDRTKFFDYIIPIVPVVDSSNSYDKFHDFFKEGGILENFDKSFLQKLSLYIDDMRILKNIYNEYVIYHDRIQSTELDYNKLLAIISYKNIFPRDFGELQLGRGFVHVLFDNKDKFVIEEKAKISGEIEDKWNQISTLESEVLEDINELDALYFIWDGYLRINGKMEKKFSSRSELIEAMKTNPDDINQLTRQGVDQFDFNNEYDKMAQNEEYLRRKEIIEDKFDKKKGKIKAQIDDLKQKKEKLESRKLNEIITRENIDDIFSVNFKNEIGEESNFNDIKSSPYFYLIKFLIRNGYIDETYPDYMTYFYGNSLSRVDKIFLRSVSDKIAKEFTYVLKDPSTVVARMRGADFEEEEVLNFSLFRYLLSSEDGNLHRFIKLLKVNERFDFILQFWKTEKETKEFVKALNYYWPSVFKGILNDNHFSDDQKRMYVVDSFYYSSTDEVLGLNEDQCLTEYISNHKDFLNIDAPNITRILDTLISLEVSFREIRYEDSNNELFRAVYKSNLYQMNISNISLILERIYNISKSKDYKHKNYTLVISQPEQELASYVKEDMNNYVDIILKECDSLINDSEDAALEIINDDNVSPDHKSAYVKYLQTKIGKIDCIGDKGYWSLFLQYGNIVSSMPNVLRYYSENKLDSNLVGFINNDLAYLDFDFDQIEEIYGGDLTTSFFKDTLLCESLNDDKYEMVMQGFKGSYEEFSYEEIPSDKFNILIKLNVIYMSSDNLQFVRDNYPDHLIPFIKWNIDQYMEVIDEENLPFSEIVRLISSDIKVSHKLELLTYTTEPISVKDQSYSEDVKLHILRNNFDIEDFSYLLKIFEQESSSLQEVIYNLSIENVDELISEEYYIPYELLIKLFKSDEIVENAKIEILICQLENLNIEQALKGLNILGMEKYTSLFFGKRPKIDKTKRNERVLDIFKSKNWITSFFEDSNDSNFYRAMGRKLLDYA